MTDSKPHEAPVHEARALPVMLPGKLVGREALLAQIYAHLKEGRAVLLHGQPGAGKTAIAATLAAAYAQQPVGALWFNVRSPQLEELIVRVGRAYDVDAITGNENPASMLGAVENTLKSNKPMIVLDGPIDANVASRFVTRCAVGLPTIIATEDEIDGPWESIAIPALDAEGAAALLKQESRLTADDPAIGQIATMVENLPLGLVVAGRAMLASKQTPSDYAGILQQVKATGAQGPVLALTTNLRALPAALQGLLLMMGATIEGRGTVGLLSLVSGAPLETVEQALNNLTQLHMLQRMMRGEDAVYYMHPVTHAFAQNWLRTSNRLDELQGKVRDATLTYAKQNSLNTPEAHNKLALEIDSFLAVARQAALGGDRDTARAFVVALTQAGDFIREQGYLYELLMLRALETGTGTAFPAYDEEDEDVAPEDMLTGFEDDVFDEYDSEDAFAEYDDEEEDYDLEEDEYDEEDEEVELQPLADRLFSDVGEDEAEDVFDAGETRPPVGGIDRIDLNTEDVNKLRSALAQYKQAGDQDKQIEVLKQIGKLQVDQTRNNEAITTYSELLNLYEAVDNQPGMLDTLDMLSALMVKTDNAQAAIMYANRGVRLAEGLGDEATRMQILVTLGDARQDLGESETAAHDYTQALALARNRGDTQNEAVILYKLGYAQLDNGDPETATETWEQALTLFKSQERRDYEGKTMGALGSAYGDQDRWSEALSFHTSALYIAREVKDRAEEINQLSSLGYAAVQARQLGQAVLRYRQALHLGFMSDDADSIVSTIVDLSRLLTESRKHLSVAELLVDRALEIDPSDKDLRQIKDRITSEFTLAQSQHVAMVPVTGTAEDYAANAYALLDE